MLLACVPVNRRVDALVRGAIDAVQTGALKPVTALPPAVRARLAGAPVQVDGNVLDPGLQLLLRLAGLVPDRPVWAVEGRRELMRSECRLVAGPRRELSRVTDLTVRGSAGQLGARLYVPKTAGDGLLVYFHGGGWVVGDLDTHDPWLRVLADDAGVRILSVDYRLAPEAEAPAAAEDAIAAFDWAVRHATDLGADPARIGVGGDSAGGNLAAVTAQLCAAEGIRLAGQVLIYPNTVYGATTESMRDNDDPALFNQRSVAWYWRHYLTSPDEGQDPRVSPLLADDVAGLPPALVVTAEYDPLRDEGEQYAARLRDSGVPVLQTRYDGMVHGFFAMAGVLDGGKQAMQQVSDWLAGRMGVV